jgi:hypothetical protein
MFIRILGYKEDGLWVAHCLEMDLIGVDRRWPKARQKLLEAISAQVSFAHFKKQFGLLWKPAPTWVFAVFEKVLEESIKSYVPATKHPEYILDYSPTPDPQDLAPDFHPAHA